MKTPCDISIVGVAVALCISTLMEPENGMAGDILWDGDVQTVVSNDFGDGLPEGWSIAVNGDTNVFWRFDDPAVNGNLTGGSGRFAEINSFYVEEYGDNANAELRSPAYAVVHTALTYLVFRTDFKRYEFPPEEVADVDVSTNGVSGGWCNVWRQTGASYQGQVRIDLTALLSQASTVVVRFHYYNANYDWWWQVDDVTLMSEADINTNGVPDWWEVRYYGGLTNLAVQTDSDHDGAVDRDEFIAGTDPTNNMSVLRLGQYAHHDGQQDFEFSTSTGHLYALMTCSDLMSGSWTNASPWIRGVGSVTNFTANGDTRSGFYRISAQRW
ncbi:MAG: hypothetical protein WCS52_03985 [bacterium]